MLILVCLLPSVCSHDLEKHCLYYVYRPSILVTFLTYRTRDRKNLCDERVILTHIPGKTVHQGREGMPLWVANSSGSMNYVYVLDNQAGSRTYLNYNSQNLPLVPCSVGCQPNLTLKKFLKASKTAALTGDP